MATFFEYLPVGILALAIVVRLTLFGRDTNRFDDKK